eukprot:gene10215-11307_t
MSSGLQGILVYDEDAKRDAIQSIAMRESTKAAAIGAGIVGAITSFAIWRSPGFRAKTTTSVRMSFPVMAALGIFSFSYEVTQHRAMLHPHKYGLVERQGALEVPAELSVLPFYQRTMNYIADNPFELVAGLGVPLAGGILYGQMGLKHLTLSQKIMHSRVYAQGGVITILLITMGFLEYMNRRGRFVPLTDYKSTVVVDDDVPAPVDVEEKK